MKALLPLILLLLTACGQSGDLYLPEAPDEQAANPAAKEN